MTISTDYPIVLLKNLPYNESEDSLFQLAGAYGPIYQIRIAKPDDRKGQCFVVYYKMESAVKAARELNGVNFHGRYILSSIYGVDNNLLIQKK